MITLASIHFCGSVKEKLAKNSEEENDLFDRDEIENELDIERIERFWGIDDDKYLYADAKKELQ